MWLQGSTYLGVQLPRFLFFLMGTNAFRGVVHRIADAEANAVPLPPCKSAKRSTPKASCDGTYHSKRFSSVSNFSQLTQEHP